MTYAYDLDLMVRKKKLTITGIPGSSDFSFT